MQHASVYRFKDRILVHPNCPTSAGILLSTAPFAVLPLTASDHELGLAVSAALASSSRVVAHPADWKGEALPRLAAAGVKTERAFQRLSSLVQILFDGTSFQLQPTHNGGGKGDVRGFHAIPGSKNILPLAIEPDTLGAELRRALALCTD